jgi:hypothetical protein
MQSRPDKIDQVRSLLTPVAVASQSGTTATKD